MGKFEVDIIETLQMRVEVEAESLEDAVDIVQDQYYDEVHILTADNCNVSTDFEGVDPYDV